jgi:hypothetical protein
MVRSSPGSARLLATVMLLAVTAATASAHRRDEYLQAARLAIDPDRVELELDLTAGIAVASTVIADIDVDHDRVLSDDEMHAYAMIVQRELHLEQDGVRLPLALLESRAATADAMERGEGTLRLRWTAPLPSHDAGTHTVRFRNRHHADVGVYLANVLVPSDDRVAVTRQNRDGDQRELTVDYDLRRARSIAKGAALAAGIGALFVAVFSWRRAARLLRT